ncbi:recombinase family protein [Hymenobacter cellulosilyticus]|uniref:recombinase family protein n=1 Tax=Hymenobacter cellulosilyticus TaxID=2932248 RepID=UPI0035CA34F1
MQRNAREHPANRQAAQLATLLREKGQTLEEIAVTLNRTGYRTRRGKDFHATSVWRLLNGEPLARTAWFADADSSAANR